VPNDTRSPRDDFSAYARRQRLRAQDARDVRQLRDSLREVLAGRVELDRVVNSAIQRHDVRCIVRNGTLEFLGNRSPAARLVLHMLHAIRAGTWPRLKACPGCEWVFYDHSKNVSKRWCVMSASQTNGRSCGTLAKVQAYRSRKAAGPKRKRA
jgi:predicted RNA-binding Zn ribbon-like protein